MQTIGLLHQKTGKADAHLEGCISTLSCHIRLKLLPAAQSANPNAPSYLIVGRGPAGRQIRIGAAWVKTIKRGDRAGEEFLSITLDDPSLPNSLNVAAFKISGTDKWEVVFRRRQNNRS